MCDEYMYLLEERQVCVMSICIYVFKQKHNFTEVDSLN